MKWIVFLFAAATSFAQTANKCADLAKFQMPGAAIEITRAERRIIPASAVVISTDQKSSIACRTVPTLS